MMVLQGACNAMPAAVSTRIQRTQDDPTGSSRIHKDPTGKIDRIWLDSAGPSKIQQDPRASTRIQQDPADSADPTNPADPPDPVGSSRTQQDPEGSRRSMEMDTDP